MAKTLANYDPLVQIPSGMTPAGADFPIVESHDILVGENDKRLDAKLDDIDSAIGNVGQTPIATQLSSKVNTGDIVTSVAATGSTSNNKIPSETAVRAAIEAKTINVDSTVTEGSTNAVSGGAVHTQLATKQDTLTFDTTPTASSNNPVTSGGVKTALDAKQDTLTFDTTPTASSNNPVTSGGVKTALDGKQNVLTYETTPIVGSVNPVTSTGIRNAIDAAAAGNLGEMQAQYDEFVAEAEDVLDRAASLSNGMVACNNIAAETTVGDTRILLYTGTTNANYTNGHWYYNSAPSNAAPSWTDGGAVGSAPTIDNTLTTAGAAADSKSVGDAIENIVTISNTQPGANSGNKVWIKETTNEEVQVPTYAEHIAKANKADIATNNESDNGSGTISASKAYAIGDHFYINNTNTSSENYGVSTLYKATAAIASGSAIVVGTNCEASKVVDELTSLSNDIDTVKADLDAHGFTDAQKNALIACFGNIAWLDESKAEQCLAGLEDALWPDVVELPEGYTRVLALKSTGTQYIDTGLKYNTGDLIEIIASGITYDSSYEQWYFGAYDSDSSLIGIKSQPNENYLYFRYGLGTYIAVKKEMTSAKKYNIKLNGNSMYVDDVLVGSYTAKTYTMTKTMYLFAYNGRGTQTTLTRGMSVYGFKVTGADGTIKQSLVPCLDDNNVPCMYDKVSKNTIYNAGSGVFDYEVETEVQS